MSGELHEVGRQQDGPQVATVLVRHLQSRRGPHDFVRGHLHRIDAVTSVQVGPHDIGQLRIIALHPTALPQLPVMESLQILYRLHMGRYDGYGPAFRYGTAPTGPITADLYHHGRQHRRKHQYRRRIAREFADHQRSLLRALDVIDGTLLGIDRKGIDHDAQRRLRIERIGDILVAVKHRITPQLVNPRIERGQFVPFAKHLPAPLLPERIERRFGEYLDAAATRHIRAEGGEFHHLHHILVDKNLYRETVADEDGIGLQRGPNHRRGGPYARYPRGERQQQTRQYDGSLHHLLLNSFISALT